MKLDDRLKKIATGVSVTDAIDAYLQQRQEPVEDPETKRVEQLLAIVEVMFLMAAVDGEVSDEEVQELRASVSALEDLQEIQGIDLEGVMKEMGERLARDGWRARLEAAASRIETPEARAFAFQLAAGVAFVDDFVAHAEAAAIDSLARALHLEREESQELLRDVHDTLFMG